MAEKTRTFEFQFVVPHLGELTMVEKIGTFEFQFVVPHLGELSFAW